jgi:sodium transport system permease protein
MAFQSRTYKEAQTRLSMLIFVPMIPGFMFAFGTLDPAPWMAVTPMIGQHMLITNIVRGEAIAMTNAVALSAVTLLAAAAAGGAAAAMLDREAVLRRAGA